MNKTKKKTNKKIYIAGKVSGLTEEYCKKRFGQAKKFLIQKGYEAVSPIEHTNADTEYKKCMYICVKLLKDCDGIYFLSNWQNSNGAKIEFQVATIMQQANKNFKIMFEK
jgi:nucleoside 2-deoxyribosyltransferase